jgi:hypothetical protein
MFQIDLFSSKRVQFYKNPPKSSQILYKYHLFFFFFFNSSIQMSNLSIKEVVIVGMIEQDTARSCFLGFLGISIVSCRKLKKKEKNSFQNATIRTKS